MDGRKKHYRKYLAFAVMVLAAIAVAGVCLVSFSNTISPQGIIVHHSALPFSEVPASSYLDAIDEIHRRRGYGVFYWGRTYSVGYHYLILDDGTVQTGRPERCEGAHARGYNSYIGICLIGDFSSGDNPAGEFGLQHPTDAQMRALIALCRRLISKYRMTTEQVFRHHSVNPETECPGDRFPFEQFHTELEAERHESVQEAALIYAHLKRLK